MSASFATKFKESSPAPKTAKRSRPNIFRPNLNEALHRFRHWPKAEMSKQITSFDKSYSSFNIASNSGTLEEAVSELETQMIKDALGRHNWNISQVARELGLTRRGLYLKLERYGIEKAA